METAPKLSERKAAILRDLVQLYIRTGEPVGSEALAAVSRLRVSSATIRNELAALEEMGYLTQPHTSAGRMPTDLGYRYFVDKLPARVRLGEQDRLAIVHFFDVALADVDQILRGTTHLLSRLTHYAALALAPSLRQSPIAHAELVRVGTGTLLLVVFDSGRVEKRLLDLPEDGTEEDVRRASATVASAVHGRTLGPAGEAVVGRAREGSEDDRRVLEPVAGALRAMQEAAEGEHVVLGGVANIAAEEAFRQRETLRGMIEALERESEVLRLLREAAANPQGVSVTIGRENPVAEMWEASVVTAPFAASGLTTGTIGVVGPLRMNYVAAISAVREVAARLSAAVQALGG